MVYSTKKYDKIFWGGAKEAQPPPQSPDPSPSGLSGGYYSPHPTPLCACGTSTPPILKFWVRHWTAISMKRVRGKVTMEG